MNNLFLDDKTYATIKHICSEADECYGHGDYNKALILYQKSLNMIPSPKSIWEASTWINTSIGLTFYQMGRFQDAISYFEDAKKCPNGLTNPFVLLKLGQCYYMNNQLGQAKENLMQAFMLDGKRIFDGEPAFYWNFLACGLEDLNEN